MTNRPLITARYFATYYYASVVRNVLYDQFSYLHSLEGFYGDDAYLEYVAPFRRRSAFHCFIQFVVDDCLIEEMGDFDLGHHQSLYSSFADMPDAVADLEPATLPLDEAFKAHGIREVTFLEWLTEHGITFVEATVHDLDAFHREVRFGQAYEDLLWQLTQEVFFVLFQNRDLLLLFNDMMARHVERTELEHLEPALRPCFRMSGRLRRVHLPTWVKRAVFFRDRGLCVMCRKDISGVLSISNRENFDHIVPLARGGLNDVSNIQLLCKHCNHEKKAGDATTSREYEAWYGMADE